MRRMAGAAEGAQFHFTFQLTGHFFKSYSVQNGVRAPKPKVNEARPRYCITKSLGGIQNTSLSGSSNRGRRSKYHRREREGSNRVFLQRCLKRNCEEQDKSTQRRARGEAMVGEAVVYSRPLHLPAPCLCVPRLVLRPSA